MFTTVNCGNLKKTELIRISEDTKKRLDKLKIHRRESYNDVIKSLLKVEETTRVKR